MHTELLKIATNDQLKEFINDTILKFKNIDYDLYNSLEHDLYLKINGYHFNEQLLKEATSKLINEDGSTGAHWDVVQSTDIAKQYNVDLNNYNEYDWNYVLNMIYSDYYGAVPNDLTYYVKLANKFINDKDTVCGKVLKYYLL